MRGDGYGCCDDGVGKRFMNDQVGCELDETFKKVPMNGFYTQLSPTLHSNVIHRLECKIGNVGKVGGQPQKISYR